MTPAFEQLTTQLQIPQFSAAGHPAAFFCSHFNQPKVHMSSRTESLASTMFTATALAALLVACGGGGSSSPTASGIKAEGVYEGTLSSPANPKFQLLVLENDVYWGLYGSQVGNTFQVQGFVQGQGSSNNGSFASTNGMDFGGATSTSAPVNATYTAAGNIAGSAGSATFSGAPIPTTNYSYNTPALLSAIAGAWNLSATNGAAFSISIGANGAFTANSGGCAMTGTITPRASGKNVFDATLTFGAAPCANPGVTGTGIALTYPTTAGNHQLAIIGLNPARTQGLAMFGTR